MNSKQFVTITLKVAQKFSSVMACSNECITSCRRVAATVCPRPSPPPWAPKLLAPPSRRQRSSSFPLPTRSHAHRCSRLTRQHGGEQSGLVTLTFDLFYIESGVRVSCGVGYLCANFGIPRPLFYSRLRPDVRDRRQTASSLNAPPRRRGHNIVV